MGKTKLDKQAKEILKIAGESGVQSNYLFVTTFKRYRFLLESLDRLEEIIEKDGEIITKEYIKGRENLVIHPALTKYNNIADGANKTAATLIRIRRYRNKVTGLFYVKDIFISVIKNFKPIFKNYTILVEGQEYKPYDFIKLLRKTTDGATGVGLTEELSKALETAYQTLLYQLGLVKSGGNKKGFLKSVRKLGQDEINVLKKAWQNLYANNESNVVVLNNGLEFQEASNSSVEMQLNESKKTLHDEINNIFHINDDFYTTFKLAIYPIIKAFETALNRDLLLEKEKRSHFFEFDVKEIVKANIKERYEAYKLAKESSFMTINEIRKAENMEYIEGLDVFNVGLGAVLYDTNTHQYYTPNTNTMSGAEIQKAIEDKEIDTAFEGSGNSSD